MHRVVRFKQYTVSVAIYVTCIFHLQLQVQVLPVWVRHFDFRLNAYLHFAKDDVITSSGDFGILKNKHNNVEFSPICNLRPSIQSSPSLSNFTKKTSTHLHFRWRHKITGWTISKISTYFRPALIEITQSTLDNSNRPLRYLRKTRGCSICSPPRCSRVNTHSDINMTFNVTSQ